MWIQCPGTLNCTIYCPSLMRYRNFNVFVVYDSNIFISKNNIISNYKLNPVKNFNIFLSHNALSLQGGTNDPRLWLQQRDRVQYHPRPQTTTDDALSLTAVVLVLPCVQRCAVERFVTGVYTTKESNHGKPVYKKDFECRVGPTPWTSVFVSHRDGRRQFLSQHFRLQDGLPGSVTVLIYYWDSRQWPRWQCPAGTLCHVVSLQYSNKGLLEKNEETLKQPVTIWNNLMP